METGLCFDVIRGKATQNELYLSSVRWYVTLVKNRNAARSNCSARQPVTTSLPANMDGTYSESGVL